MTRSADTAKPGDTLFQAIQKTTAANSVSLYDWGRRYPVLRTVVRTETWLPTTDTSTAEYAGHEKYDVSHAKKTIWATGSVHDLQKHYRIEYDPTTDYLLTWYEVKGDGWELEGGFFKMFLRSENPNASYFGATLPD